MRIQSHTFAPTFRDACAVLALGDVRAPAAARLDQSARKAATPEAPRANCAAVSRRGGADDGSLGGAFPERRGRARARAAASRRARHNIQELGGLRIDRVAAFGAGGERADVLRSGRFNVRDSATPRRAVRSRDEDATTKT